MNTCARIIVFFMVILMWIGGILLVVCSGVAYSYFKSDLLLSVVNVNLKIMFGCGIGAFIILLGLQWFYLIWPEVWLTSLTIMGTYVVICSLYIVYTRPSMTDTYLDRYNGLWKEDDPEITSFQFHHKCCGWINATDRGIPICPFEFASGCAGVIEDYLGVRFKEIFIWTIVGFALIMLTWIVTLPVTLCSDEPNVLSAAEWLDAIWD